VDKHPNYLSTQWGEALAAQEKCKLTHVQHHHAHIASCMAEHGLPLGSRVLGIVLDGLGMGLDNELWGGEFLLASYPSFERVGSIQQAAMLGGSKAMHEPWRNTYAQLHGVGWQDISTQFAELDVIQMLNQKDVRNLDVMLKKGLNSPLASSAGRLFDAVAAALGICAESVSFEGQAAMALEVAASQVFQSENQRPYPVEVENMEGIPTLMWRSMWLHLLSDLKNGVSRNKIAARFHQTLIQAISKLATDLAKQHHMKQVVLSGGVFQNKLLFEGVAQHLTQHGLTVLVAKDYPLNDGGLSLGQAVVSAAQSMQYHIV